jgi:hypothetical protein
LSCLGLCPDLSSSGGHGGSRAPPEPFGVETEDFWVMVSFQGSVADDLGRVPIEVCSSFRRGWGFPPSFANNGSKVRVFDTEPLEAITSMILNNFKTVFGHSVYLYVEWYGRLKTAHWSEFRLRSNEAL